MPVYLVVMKLQSPENSHAYKELNEILYRYKNFGLRDDLCFIDKKESIFEIMRKLKAGTALPEIGEFLVIKQDAVWECSHFIEFRT